MVPALLQHVPCCHLMETQVAVSWDTGPSTDQRIHHTHTHTHARTHTHTHTRTHTHIHLYGMHRSQQPLLTRKP